MNQKLVSVILVNKNYDQFIRSAIESVLNQTYPHIEVVVVDDHSTDSSISLIKEYARDSRLTLIRSQGNGVSAARNQGLRLAKGEYVAFLDSDDFYVQEKIQLQLEVINSEDLDGVTNDVFLKWTSSTTGDLVAQKTTKMDYLSFQKSALGVGGYLMSTLLIKRSILEKIDWFDETLSHGEDYDFASRIYRDFKVGHLPQYLSIIRRHSSNTSTSPGHKYQVDVRNLASKFLRENSHAMSKRQILKYIYRSSFGVLKYSIKSKHFLGCMDALVILLNLSHIYRKKRPSV